MNYAPGRRSDLQPSDIPPIDRGSSLPGAPLRCGVGFAAAVADMLRNRQRHGGSIALTDSEANGIATLIEGLANDWKVEEALERRR